MAALCGTLVFLCIASPAPSAQAAPSVVAVWSSSVFSVSARLQGQVNPNGTPTTYHFEYLTKAAYDANLAASKDPFDGALRSPTSTEVNLGSGANPVSLLQFLSNLTPDTAYRYRVVTDPASSPPDTAHAFTTQAIGGGSVLLDGRGWEMVSPVDKNGGEVESPGALLGGGVLQAATAGSQVTYSSGASFDKGAGGAPPANQYIATRGAGGWSSQDIDPPIFSDTYNAPDGGVPYQLFSEDLTRGVLLNGNHCRGDASGCAVANPPLTGTDAPAGYQNYYLREGGGFAALLGSSNAGFLDLAPADFDLRFAGASPDLSHIVVSTCAKLTADATEVAAGSGCDPAEQNLYEWSAGSGLGLLNGAATGASLAAPRGRSQATAPASTGPTPPATSTSTTAPATTRSMRRPPSRPLRATAPPPSTPRPAPSTAMTPPPTPQRRPRKRRGRSARRLCERRRRLLPGRLRPAALAQRRWDHPARPRRRGRPKQLPAEHRNRSGQRRRHKAPLRLQRLPAQRLRQHRPRQLRLFAASPPVICDSQVYLYDAARSGNPHLPLLQPDGRATDRRLERPRLDPQRQRPRLHRLLQAPRPLRRRATRLLRFPRRDRRHRHQQRRRRL